MKIQALINLGYNGPVSEQNGVLTFQDPTIPRPSDEEIEAEAKKLRDEFDSKEYQRKRLREYPSVRDLADAVYHQQNGNNEPMQKYLQSVKCVKDKYPKQ